MARTVSELRQLEHAETAYILFIEGLPYAWVTDHPYDGLLGYSSNSWIGVSEAEIGLPEATGQRTVLPGLKLPDDDITIGSVDLKSGMLNSTTADFDIVDFDGTLLRMFATEGKEYDELAQHIPPGTGFTGDIIACVSGGVDPRGKHIGLEKIDAGGRRRQFPTFPFGQMVGYQHAPPSGADDGPPMVTVSDEPLDFAGRLVALYRLYRDTSSSSTGHTSWPSWKAQHDAGGLVWWGTLRDSGELSGDRVWKLQCKGHDSLMRRRLGALSPSEPIGISGALTELSADERRISVFFETRTAEQKNDRRYQQLESSASYLMPASGTPTEFIAAMRTFVYEALNGTTVNGNLSLTTADTDMTVRVDLESIQVSVHEVGSLPERGAVVHISCHEKIWRALGYEPQVQGALELDAEKYVKFLPVTSATAGKASGADYWDASFYNHHGELFAFSNIDWDNDGIPRIWRPAYDGGVGILHSDGRQLVYLGQDLYFLERSLTTPYSENSTVNGGATNRARYFAFKGVRAVGKARGFDDVEFEETIQVARCSWRESGSYGSIALDSGTAALFIEEWLDPRSFGFPYDRLENNSEWSFIPGSPDHGIQLYPLNAYAYAAGAGDEKSREHAGSVLSQILLSTGAATGYPSALENTPRFSTGPNDAYSSFTFAQLYGGDTEIADLGLGIPSELVASTGEIRKAFDAIGDGINRVRYAYFGPFDSYSTIESLIRPRGLMLTLRGGKIGVAKLGPFPLEEYDVQIDENDLYGRQGDPSDVRPKQRMRATGQLDKVVFRSDWHPIEGSTQRERNILSRDAGAKHRPGDLVEEVEEHGLRSTISDQYAGDMFRLWADQRPKYFAQRHFLVTSLTVNRIKGQDLAIGSRVLFTNPWVVSPTSDGYEGVSKAAGLVTSVTLNGKEHSYDVELLVFAGQFGEGWKYFYPVGRIRRVTGTEIELYPDSEFMDHGEGSDASRLWVKPEWLDSEGNASVGYLEHDRTTWTLSNLATVSAVDPDTNTITLATPFATTPKRDTDKLLVMLGPASQGAAWALQLGLPVVLDTHRYGAGVKGQPFNDKKKS